MNIGIVGTGYVGLVTGTCFANAGNSVTCLDIDQEKLGKLRKGQAHFFEPGLSELMKRTIKAERLLFTDNTEEAFNDTSIIFICVGTPTAADGNCDLSGVMAVADSLAAFFKDSSDRLPRVVMKSTVPVGTTHGRVGREVCADQYRRLGSSPRNRRIQKGRLEDRPANCRNVSRPGRKRLAGRNARGLDR